MRLTHRIAALAAGTALAAGSVLATAPAANAVTPTAGEQVVTALLAGYDAQGDGNPYDFDIVTTAIIATGLTDSVKSLTNFTVFAPNDRAFEVLAKKVGALPRGYTYGATVNETRIVDVLVTKLGVDTIRKVVLYHVLNGAAVTGAQAAALPVWGTKLTMLNGQTLTVTNFTKLFGTPAIFLGDKDGSFLNDYVVKSKIDVVKVPGGVVHGISDVLMPAL